MVGAGIVGCSIAHELARRGASVQFIEERATGMGATQASAGILAPHVEAGASNTLLSLAVRSLTLFDDFVAAGTRRDAHCQGGTFLTIVHFELSVSHFSPQ